MYRRSDSDPFFLSLMFSGLGIFFFFDGFRKWRRKRIIENIPTSKIRSLALGLVEIEGQAEQRVNLINAPLSGKGCIFYKYLVERLKNRGKHSSWVKVAQDCSFHHPFYLNDGTGRVLVDPQNAELNLDNPDFEFKTSLLGSDYPVNLLDFLIKNNIRYKSFLGKQSMRFQEWRIHPRDTVYVLGSARKNETFASDLRLRLNEKLKQIKADPLEMKKIDVNNDGTVSVEEWEEAVKKTQQKLLEEELKNADVSNEGNLVVGKGAEEKIFMISEKSEKELLNSLSAMSALKIFGGAILASIGLAWLGYLLKIIK